MAMWLPTILIVAILVLNLWRVDDAADVGPQQPHIERDSVNHRIEASASVVGALPGAAMPPGEASFPDTDVVDDWWWRTPMNATMLGSPRVLLDHPAD